MWFQMASEDHRPSSGGRSASQIDRDAQHIATSIAQKLQEARLRCEIVNLLPVEAAVLRRDRIVVILALTLLTTLAASYMLWLSADMAMGGMNMSGFRMIPSGMGLMIPAEQPWQGMEFVFVFAMWTVMMIGHDDALGSADGSHVCPYRPTNWAARHTICRNRLVRVRLFPYLDRVRAARHASALGI